MDKKEIDNQIKNEKDEVIKPSETQEKNENEKKVEIKEEIEEIKEEPKEESKEESKENSKEEAKDDSKKDSKEESKDDLKTNKEKYKEFYEDSEPYVIQNIKKEKKNYKVLKTVCFSLLGVLLLVYLGGVIYFSNHFAGKTTLNTYDISGKSISSAQNILDEELAKYELSVIFKNGTEKLLVGDGNIKVELADSMKTIRKKQNAWLWPFNIFDKYTFMSEYVVSFDKETLKNKINEFSYMQDHNMKNSINARVRMEDGEVIILPDETGTKLDKELVYQSIADALTMHADSVDLDIMGCYVIADITVSSDIIAKGVENAKSFLETEVNYDFNGYKMPITKEALSSLAYIDGNGNIQISESNVDAYARQFAREKSTCNTYRDFKTSDGRMIQVYGSWFGWQLDEDACSSDLMDAVKRAIKGEKEITLTPAFTHEGYSYGEYNDIGDTYVEVDLGHQHMYMYVKGERIVESDIVSGNWSKGMSTPGGLYAFTGKGYQVTLVGADYETPVTYWMPFNGGIGLHDAVWRSRFGGSIYAYDGSHGCVNLPYKVAATVFANMEVGMPVVCYWD